MKTKVIIVMLLVTSIMYSQKTKNGTVYKEHPAIVAVESCGKPFILEIDKMASYLADDFRSYKGTSTNKDAKGRDKENFLKEVKMGKRKLVLYQL